MIAYHGYGRILSDTTKDQIQYMLMFRDTIQHGYWPKWSRFAAYEKTGGKSQKIETPLLSSEYRMVIQPRPGHSELPS